MWEWLNNSQNQMNMVVALIALIFGGSARTIRSLKSQSISVRISWQEWLSNQMTAVPIGLIALWVVPTYQPDIKPPVLLALMVGVGLFSTEAYVFVKRKLPKG